MKHDTRGTALARWWVVAGAIGFVSVQTFAQCQYEVATIVRVPGCPIIGPPPVEELVVRFHEPPTLNDLERIRTTFPAVVGWRSLRHVTHPKNDPTGVHPLAYVRVATLDAAVDSEEASSLCSTLAKAAPHLLRRVEPNGRLEFGSDGEFVPNDPLYPEQWALDRIGIQGAWQRTTGSQDVVMAVLDTGLNLNHEEFPAETFWSNPGEVPDNGLDDDKNGFVDDVIGWDFVFDDNWPEQWNAHGTLVTGVLAARINNGLGIAGIANSPLMMVSVSANFDRVIEGSYYATDMGASVINVSIAGESFPIELAEAVQYAWDNGVTVVSGAGNRGVSNPHYPAAFPTVIAVSGTTRNDERWEGSNYGDWIDVAAPSIDVLTTSGDTYELNGGTSIATPYVAGLAVLLYSVDATLTPAEVMGLIRLGADDLGEPGFDEFFGYGRINANSTVDLAVHLANCPSDLNFDNTVGMADVLHILSAWSTENWLVDIDDNGVVDFGDLLTVLATWGPCQ